MKELDPETLDRFISSKDASLVMFHADWCPFCRKFRPVFESYEGKSKLKMAEAKVNEDENPFWDRFGIEVVPTMILFKGSKVIGRKDGRAGAGLVEDDIKQILKDA